MRDRSAPKSQTLIVPSSDPDTILVPSGENTTDRMVSLWALVFSATQLMSFAIILRTREKRAFGGKCIRQHGDMGPHTAASSKGTSRVSTQTSNSQQRAARMRGMACGRRVAPKLIANGELHALERGSTAQGLRVGQSCGGETRGGGEERGGLVVGARLRKGTRKESTLVRRRETCRGKGVCSLRCRSARGHRGRKHLSGFDRFRVRRGCGGARAAIARQPAATHKEENRAHAATRV